MALYKNAETGTVVGVADEDKHLLGEGNWEAVTDGDRDDSRHRKASRKAADS